MKSNLKKDKSFFCQVKLILCKYLSFSMTLKRQ